MKVKVNGRQWNIWHVGGVVFANEIEEHEGWEVMWSTPVNERTVFKCKTCGRESNTPDKTCNTGVSVDFTELLS